MAHWAAAPRLHWQALDATEAEEQTFDASHAGMAQGWGGAMDHLAAHLAAEQDG